MNKKIITLTILGTFLLMFLSMNVSAIDYTPHTQDTDFTFSITSNNATGCNLTLINTPTDIIIINQVGTKTSQTFNFSIDSGNYSEQGDYCHQIECFDGSNYNTGDECRSVSLLGKELTTSKAISYFVIFIISILVFMGLLLLGIYLPEGNKKDELTGYILAISNLKYLKYVILGFSYLTLLWLSYFSWMVVYAYLDFNFLSNIFRFMFTFLAVLTFPLFILFCYLTIANLIRDSKVGESLSYGLQIK